MKFKNDDNDHDLTTEDILTIKTGELIAKTQELDEANESIYLSNSNLQAKIDEIKKSKSDLLKSDNSLLFANEELAKTNEKFAKVNKELAAVNKELARINEQINHHHIKQKEFIHIASHELRTPTQAILGYVELLLSEPQTKYEYAEPLMRNATRLQKIISNILDISKIDNDMLIPNIQRFNLTKTILQIVEDMRTQIIRENKDASIIYDPRGIRGVDKEKEEDIFIDGDKERISQVISNILDNAIRFVKEGTITISVDTNNTINSNDDGVGNSPKEILISIKDSGKGIDPEVLPLLFTKLTSKDGAAGNGLGLFICKNIVKAHGGRIWAKNNKEGNGATFSFSIPLRD